MGGPLAGYTARAQQKLASRMSYAQLIEAFRNGPPKLSLFAVPRLEEAANTVEYFVHHEDVRRAQPGWEPRKVDPGLTEVLWDRLRMARFVLRKAPVGVELARDDSGEADPPEGAAAKVPYRITAKRATPLVTVTGTPAELTLWAMGRIGRASCRERV